MSDNYGQAAALAEIETELGAVMTFSGNDYPCIVGALNDSAELGAGGFAPVTGIDVVVRRSLFAGSIPTAHDKIVLGGKTLKIEAVLLSPDQSCVVLTCNDVNKDS